MAERGVVTTFVLLLALTMTTGSKYEAYPYRPTKPDCSRSEYTRCVGLADPLIREPNLIFPDNMDDIDSVCRTWNQFVDCLKRYIDYCFTDKQRKEFNKAVENPIESVHQMCTQPSYQKEYLKYASCIKSTVTEVAHCGPQYALLVEQVSKGEAIARASLCCSHHRFKQCVYKETQRLCDGDVPNGNAARFSGQIIDKALKFLQDQCYNYIPNSGDCPVTTTTMDQLYTSASLNNDVRTTWSSSSGTTFGRDVGAGSPSTHAGGGGLSSTTYTTNGRTTSGLTNTYPESTYSSGVPTSKANEYQGSLLSDRERDIVTNSRDILYRHSVGGQTDPLMNDHSTEVSWMPGQTMGPINNNNNNNGNGLLNSGLSRDPTQISIISSGRTRPSSYGRSSSWTPAGSETTVKPDWATISTWHVYTQGDEEKISTTGTTWYPAAGSYGNSIDEPNQQGLSKLPNGSTASTVSKAKILGCLAAVLTLLHKHMS